MYLECWTWVGAGDHEVAERSDGKKVYIIQKKYEDYIFPHTLFQNGISTNILTLVVLDDGFKGGELTNIFTSLLK